MPNYSNPWREKATAAERAKAHIELMQQKYPSYIEMAERDTKHLFQESGPYLKKTEGSLPKISVVNTDTVSAAFSTAGRTAILDFASYKNPGGMFLEGSMAQEEALCHASALYNILSSERLVHEFYESNKHRLNRSLYHDNLLYVPFVPFVRKAGNGKYNARLFDVIVCAAPNKGAAQKYQNVSDAECENVMRMRIRAVLSSVDTAAGELLRFPADNIVLGAFGCGVFKNDPATVARLFREELAGRHFMEVVFAVPGDKYEIFRKELMFM